MKMPSFKLLASPLTATILIVLLTVENSSSFRVGPVNLPALSSLRVGRAFSSQSIVAAVSGDDEGATTSRLEITTITKSFADDQGMTEWPALSKNSDFSSRYDTGEQLYVLEGSATLMISDFIDGIVTEELKVSQSHPPTASQS